jgi:hypothetical protein
MCHRVLVQVLASLPPELQKDVVESAKRRQRLKSRQQFMPVRQESSGLWPPALM